MMIAQTVFALVAAVPFATAFPTYHIPAAMYSVFLANDDCFMPEDFTVDNLVIWSPAADNQNKAVINFDYADLGTGISTACHYNWTSVNVGPVGSTERWACDDGNVQFIWQSQVGTNGSLTLIEKACPQTSMSAKFEASGSIRPELSCVATDSNSTLGNGNACVSQKTYDGKFTSLQPIRSL